MNFKHILVATDLSDAARQTYPHAVALAKALGTKLTVLHVDEVADRGMESIKSFEGYLQMVSTARRERIEQLKEDFEDLGVPEVDIVIEAGEAKKVIDRFARERGADLVVIARHGRGLQPLHLMGSVAQHIVRLAEVPVMVVPIAPGAPPTASDALALPRYEHVLAATDLSDASRLGLQATLNLAGRLHARVTAAHVIHWPTLVSVFPGEAPLVLTRSKIHDLRIYFKRELDKSVEGLTGAPLETRVVLGDTAAETLVEAATNLGASLLTIPSTGKGALKRWLLGSTTERVVKRATVPVIVMPPAFLNRHGELPLEG